jgi:pimeloyl-ACP methyl ester carboxylesterase
MSLLEFALLAAVATAAAAGATRARSADGVSIRYDVTGQGEPTLVLVHGWTLDRHLWDAQVPALARRHRVVTLDLAGHGESGRERARWTMSSLGEDVKAVVDAVGAKDIVLVGHSMGGPVVLEAARRMPERVRGIVLVDTLLDVSDHMPPDQIEGMAKQLEADYKGTVARMSGDFLFAPATPPAVRERVLAGIVAFDPVRSLALLREVWAYDPAPALREIQAPVRAVNADKFPTNVQANRKLMPGFEVTLVPGSGHYPMLEQPDRFAAALDTALGQVLAPKQ